MRKPARIAFLFLISYFIFSPARAQYRLWYDRPAMTWTQALPVGNGVMGGMVFGTPAVEHIQLNEETLWAGQPNQVVNPNAREAMDRFKMEAASEVGVNLKQGYNGDLTSKQAGSVGGQMVKNVCPVRKMKFRRKCRTSDGHFFTVRYEIGLIT